MTSKRPKRETSKLGTKALAARLCEALDHSIPGLRTVLMIGGLVAAAAQVGKAADFLFVTGLLFQLAIWFENLQLSKKRTG
ncbi:hypothetical protein AB595_15480 [Massilia sp. WF1]|uniref:hypothetical protein n=1 Tax=unclassified Massilia TaxID=2609279 RepID=UPI0006497BD7|nr:MULTISPECIES: hypothetical protein [unclassified Massilia]KLU35923.1 hypothetical protein AB595_15480 [Massilia sp. WF1]